MRGPFRDGSAGTVSAALLCKIPSGAATRSGNIKGVDHANQQLSFMRRPRPAGDP
jgi:hypothetical protein